MSSFFLVLYNTASKIDCRNDHSPIRFLNSLSENSLYISNQKVVICDKRGCYLTFFNTKTAFFLHFGVNSFCFVLPLSLPRCSTGRQNCSVHYLFFPAHKDVPLYIKNTPKGQKSTKGVWKCWYLTMFNIGICFWTVFGWLTVLGRALLKRSRRLSDSMGIESVSRCPSLKWVDGRGVTDGGYLRYAESVFAVCCDQFQSNIDRS